MRGLSIVLLFAVVCTALFCLTRIDASAADTLLSLSSSGFTLGNDGSGQDAEQSAPQDSEPPQSDPPTQNSAPPTEDSRIAMNGADLLLYAENMPFEMTFVRNNVTVVFPTQELVALNIPPEDILQIEILRDNPTRNGIYVGFYINSKVLDIKFETPYKAHVELEGASGDVKCIDPDGSSVESYYDEASGKMVISLYMAGEYIFLLPDTPSTRPPSLEELVGDTGEASGQDEDIPEEPDGEIRLRPAAVADDFVLIAAAAALLAVIMRIVVKKVSK